MSYYRWRTLTRQSAIKMFPMNRLVVLLYLDRNDKEHKNTSSKALGPEVLVLKTYESAGRLSDFYVFKL